MGAYHLSGVISLDLKDILNLHWWYVKVQLLLEIH